jgi:Ca-activated chloride channel homolog
MKMNVKKFVMSFKYVVVLILIIVQSVYVNASTEIGSKGIDTVIVIDVSGSMNQTDSDRIAIEAAKLYIDMLEMEGSRVGIVAFSNKIVNNISIRSADTLKEKADLKLAVDNLNYAGDTDIGIAIREAVNMLESASDIGNTQSILFLTDGRIDLPNELNRTDSDSLADAQKGIIAAVGKYPMYTIGLNANGQVDKQLINQMAADTDGRSYIVNSANELPNIFNEIFADFINSNLKNLGDFTTDGVNATSIIVDIPDDNVLEANIILLSTDKLTSLKVYNPLNEEMIIGGSDVVLSESSQYSLVKLLTPTQGDWRILIEGVSGCSVHVNLLLNYNLVLKVDSEVVNHGRFVKLKGFFESEDQILNDFDLYQMFSSEVVLINNGKEVSYPMTSNSDGFSVELANLKLGDYEAYLLARSDSFYRTSSTILFSVSNEAPVIDSSMIDDIELKGLTLSNLSREVDFNSYLSDPEGDELITEIKVIGNNTVNIETISSGKYRIVALENGKTEVEVIVEDIYGAKTSMTIPVEVNAKYKSLLPLVLIAIGAIIVILLVFLILRYLKKMKHPFYGVLYYESDSYDSYSTQEKSYELGYKVGKLSLGQIITDTSIPIKELNKITIYPDRLTNNGIEVVNKSNELLISVGISMNTSGKFLMTGEDIVIISLKSEPSISLKVRYSAY